MSKEEKLVQQEIQYVFVLFATSQQQCSQHTVRIATFDKLRPTDSTVTSCEITVAFPPIKKSKSPKRGRSNCSPPVSSQCLAVYCRLRQLNCANQSQPKSQSQSHFSVDSWVGGGLEWVDNRETGQSVLTLTTHLVTCRVLSPQS